MARRKQPAGPNVPVAAEFPAELRREAVTVEHFVPRSEQPPPDWCDNDGPEYRWWRQLRALRRWQDAVHAWGAEHGLDRWALTTLGYWPGRPPLFEADEDRRDAGRVRHAPQRPSDQDVS